ncbi:heterokaryon incompatibility protein-domain-containing protein [Paraphoma chrysanthemicola]|nr:heterokaryon incompatibility protein-domain-containing protein [Paraphoma chrysanthemicola]
MRLLTRSKTGELSLTNDFIDNQGIPPYAILSHTWDDGEEVTFLDFTNGKGKNKKGHKKIQFCGEQAERDGLRYFWVDTCCIDKSNSVELSEAINSMFRWYQGAVKCYVYLSDVSTEEYLPSSDILRDIAFKSSRWFTRGWTLQELLAPMHVEFFSVEGVLIGDKSLLKSQIHDITGIPIDVLQGRSPSSYSFMERSKWAERRRTTRSEDMAYCMLGLFGICMPLLYGEGSKNAFRRLFAEVNIHSSSPTNKSDNMRTEHTLTHRIEEDEQDHQAEAFIRHVEKRLLQHLKFSAISDREERITKAFRDTFEWIYLEHASDDVKWTCFVRWLQRDDGLYWITGKAGSGKSTLMKFLHLDPRTAHYLTNWAGSSKLVVAGHFFWNSGSPIQMSFHGLVRTLLYEIAQDEAISMADLFPERWEELRSNLISDRTSEKIQPWTTSECLESLRKLLVYPFDTMRFFFFVDGLDEFSGEYTELIELLKEMAARPHIKMCVASRPWSVFQDAFNTGPNLTLQDLTRTDIRVYVNTKFYENRGFLELEKGNSKLATELTDTIMEKASGVFLWVRLAVQSLLHGLANGDRKTDLTRRLEELPEDLEMLFRKILDSIDPIYKVHSSQLFQLHRTGSQYADGVALLLLSYADDDDQALREEGDTPLGLEEFFYRMRSMERRLDSRTKGLLEAPTWIFKEIEPELRSSPDSWNHFDVYEHMNPRVQYLHRTLKDYIEQPKIWTQIRSPAPSFDPHLSLFKANALSIKGLEYRVTKTSESESPLHLRFRIMVDNAMRAFKRGKSSEWKQLINTFDAFLAIFTRKFVREGWVSTDDSISWRILIDRLSPIGDELNATDTETWSTARWQEVTDILLSYGVDRKFLRDEGFDRVCEILDDGSSARTISVKAVKEFENEGEEEIDSISSEESSEDASSRSQHRQKRQRIH